MTKTLRNNTRNTIGNSFRIVKNCKGFFKSIILSICIFVGISGGAWGQVSLITSSDGGFENATSAFTNNGWTAVGTSARTWRVGTYGGAATGTNAAYWGTATAFGGSASSAVGHFYRDIAIPAGATNVFLNYKLKYPTVDSGWDYFYVFTTTTSNTPVNGTIPTTGYTTRFTNTATAYAAFTAMTQVNLTALAGTTVRLVFTFKSDAVTPNSAPAVDDITLTYIAASACSGTPNLGTAVISSSSVCPSTAFNLSATGLSSGTGITYQWQSSPDNSTWTNITNATTSTYSTSIASGLMYYRIQTSCTSSGITSNSSSVSATTVSCINMSNGSTTLTGNANFYDTGGSGANYTSYQAYTYTVYPASCNNVRAVFSSFATESCCDYMIVYNGNSTSAPSLGTFYTMTTNQTFNSTAADGSLTFYFYSDGSVVAAGWAATLSNIAVSSGPAVPTGFAGLLNPEVGSTQSYSVTAVSGATYAWTFPSGWVINSGQGTNSVSVTVGGTNGNISVTPTRCSLAGTAYSVATTIPNYRWKYISSSLGSATWTGGEARNIDITIKNTGVSTWNTTYVNNIGVRWNSTNTSLSGTPWVDYFVRTSVGSLAPGATGTFTLPIEAKDATAGPTYSTNLADGIYYLAFDMVSEGQCWFSGNTGICGPGNTIFYSAAQTVASTPSLSCSSLTAFGNVCTDASATNSFTVSGVNLTNNVSIAALSGYSYSTSAGGSYTSTLTLSPSSGSISQTVYVNFTPTAASAYTGNIVASSTGATSQNIAASGTGIQATTVNAGSDFNLCSGQSVPMNASTNATSISGSASSGTVTVSGTDNTNPTATYTFTGLPAGASINGITVNVTSAGGGYCPSWYSVTTRLNGVQQGVAGCAASTIYTNLNGQAANGLVVAVRGQDNDAWGDAMTISYNVTLNYTINPIYSWSPATALSATNVLNPNCSATSTTTYTLTVTGTNGCVASDQVVASVAGSAPTASAGAALSAICSGATTAAMGGSVGGAASGGTWTGGTGSWTNATNPATATYTAGASETGTLTLTLTTSGGGCGTATATKTIVVNALPVVSAGPDQTICNGQTAQLAGAISFNANLINEAFESGVFPPSGWSTAVTNAAYTWGTTTGVTGMSGTSARVGWNYTQNEKLRTPSVSLSNLSASSLQFDMSMSYYWSVSPYNNMDFNVKVSSNGGSTWTSVWSEASLGAFTTYQTYPITVNLASYLGGNIIVSFEYVGNDAADLYLDNVKIIGTPILAYSWTPSAALSNAAISNPVATLSTSTIYTLTGTLSGCSSIDAMTVTVTPTNTASAASSSPTLCINTALTAITHTTTGATGIGTATGLPAGVTAAWANNTITISGTPSASGTFSYTIPLTGGCGSVNATGTITVNASPTANAGADITDASTCGKNTVPVSASALASGTTGQWSVVSGTGNTLFSLSGTAANDNFTGTFGQTYTLGWTVTDTASSCTATDNMLVTFNQPNATSLGVLIGDQDVLWNGLSSSDWSTSNNWYQKQAAGHYIRMTSGQPGTNTEVYTISNAVGGMCIGNNMPTLSVTSNAEDVYVNTGMSLNLTNDIINLVGNLTNHGTINASTGTINFTGGLSSTISGTGTTSLFNLTVNKTGTAALTISQPVTVTGLLDMTLGNILTSTNSILTLGNSSAFPGTLSWTSGNIVGPFRRYFEPLVTSGDAGLFPVGTSAYNRYARINFTSSPGSNEYLTVRYVSGAPMSGGIPLYNGLPLMITGAMIQNYSADGYWQVDPTGGSYSSSIASTSYDVTLFANNLTGMTTPQICRIIKSPGSNASGSNHVVWQACGTPVAVATGAAPSSFAITSTAVTGFSWFNVGSPNGQALPVELMSFSGNCADGQVNLEWQTASEHNSLYFEVEKSRDGENWQVLSTVPSAGNSTELLTYSAVDAHAGEGNNYYRLNQVDIDGANKVYDIINVSCSGGNKGYFSTYPNPSSGSFQVVLNNKEMLGAATLSIRDTKGASLLQREIEVKPGINLFSINDLNLAPGVYYIQVLNGDQTTELIKEVIR